MNGKAPHNFLFGDVRSLDFSDASKVFVNFYDNSFIEYQLSDVESFRFYNRWSNPHVLLKAQYTGAYEGLFSTTVQPFGLLPRGRATVPAWRLGRCSHAFQLY